MSFEPILAGFGKVNITPELDAAGTFEILDPIYIRALHLRQGSRQATFLAADLFLLDDRFHEILARALQDTDVDPDWVLRGASHLGTGPTFFQYYVNQPTEALKQFGQEARYAQAAAEAVRLAVADLAPARLAVGAGEVQGLSYNRRAHDADGRLVMVSLTQYPEPPDHLRYDPVDPQLGVLRCDRDGRPPLALVNFGCHALALWARRGNISADYPGRLMGLLADTGIEALFFQGALGNVHPVRKTDDPCGRIARGLADEVLRVWHTLQPQADLALKFHAKTVAVGRQPALAVGEAKQAWAAQPPSSEGLARYRYWLAENYAGMNHSPYRYFVVTLGSAALLHMPGEPFVETAQAIRQAAPFQPVLILTNPCPEVGYLPTPEAHAEGGDEPQFAPLEAQAEVVIRRGALEVLREAADRSR